MNRDELVAAASQKAESGDLRGALADLDAAAALPDSEADDRAWSLQLGASAARLLGDLRGARRRADEAVRLAAPKTPAKVGALIELGEAALAGLDVEIAQAAFDQVLGFEDMLKPETRATILRRRALAWRLGGDSEQAAADLAAAADLGAAGGTDLADRIARLAVLLERGTDPERLSAEAVAVGLRALEAGDHVALADLAFLDADRALRQDDVGRAVETLGRARDEAREAGDPVRYLSALVALSELAVHRGDDIGAYEPLATGWATLSKVVGDEAARAALRPRLVQLRERLGVPRFNAAKSAYEQRRH
jgi:hypothetical protein